MVTGQPDDSNYMIGSAGALCTAFAVSTYTKKPLAIGGAAAVGLTGTMITLSEFEKYRRRGFRGLFINGIKAELEIYFEYVTESGYGESKERD